MQYMNTYDFDYTTNYQALLACILNPELTTEKALGIIAQISVRSEKSTKLSDDLKVKVIEF